MISVVMPGYNVEKTVGENLEALLKQTKGFKEKVEVIFVDDGSRDKTVEVVKKFGVRVIKQKHAGPAVARNRGMKAAKGRIVIFLDADCKISGNWLKEIIKPFKDGKVAGVGVKYETWNKNSWVARFVGYEIEYRHDKMGRDVDFLASYSTAFRKDVLLKLGGFDMNFRIASAEDNDLSYRIKDAGYNLIFLKNIFVHHKHPESFMKYLQKQYNHAKWRVFLYTRNMKNAKFLAGDKYAGPSAFIQPFLLLLVPLSMLFFSRLTLWAAALNLVINLPVAAMVWRKRDYLLSALVPFLFLFRNVAWLLGMCNGILRMLLKSGK